MDRRSRLWAPRWGGLAASAAFHFGVLEDLGLVAAALVLVAAGIPRLTDRFATSNQ